MPAECRVPSCCCGRYNEFETWWNTRRTRFVVFLRNGRVHLNRLGRQFSRLLAAEVCASAVVMLDAPRFEVVWRVLATHSIRQFPIHFPSRASPCAIRFQTHYTYNSLSTLNQGCADFPNIWGPFQNLGARWVLWWKFQSDTVRNLIAQATWRSVFVHPCFRRLKNLDSAVSHC